jgi:cytochrome c1
MTDHSHDDNYDDDTGTAIEQPAMSDAATLMQQMPVDAYATVFAFIRLITDSRTAKRTMRELRDAANAANSARAQLAADRAEHDRVIAAELAEITDDRAKVREQQVANHIEKERLEETFGDRERVLNEREQFWKNLGEDDDVRRGFRAAEFSWKLKARAAHGYTVDAPLDDIAKEMAEKFPRAAPVAADRHGQPFPPDVTLTHKPEEPPAGVRIRVGRKSPAPQPGA